MGTGTSRTTKQKNRVSGSSFLDDNYPNTNTREGPFGDNESNMYSVTPDNGRFSLQTQYEYTSVEEDDYPVPGSVSHAWWSQAELYDSSFPGERSKHASGHSSMPANDVTTSDALGKVSSCKDRRSGRKHESFDVKETNKSDRTRHSLTGNVSYIDPGNSSHTTIDTSDPGNRPKAAKRSRSASATLRKNKDFNNCDSSRTKEVGNGGGDHFVQDGDKEEVVDLVQLIARLLRENQVVSGAFNNFEEMQNCGPKSKFTVKVSVRPNSHVCEIILPESMFFADNQPT